MNTRHRQATTAAILTTALVITACGGSDDNTTASAATSPATHVGTAVSSTAAAPATTAPDSAPATTVPDSAPLTAPPSTTDPSPPTTTGADWRGDVAAVCEHFAAMLSVPEPDGTPASVVEFLAAQRRIRDTSPLPLDTVGVGPDSPLDPDRLAALQAQGEEYLAAAEAAATGGDVGAAFAAFDYYLDVLQQTDAVFLVAGARCSADPSRAAGASLNVPLANHPHQLESGFGSVWVSAGLGTNVVRVDPDTGEILATIDVAAQPVKLQPADGRMWVRTADTYVAIDPATNTVTATLRKADVGPAANRSWAVDGAQWICDGQRLHRYDPTTLQPVAVIELGLDCGAVYATAKLVVAWTFNEDDGQSGTSAAAFIDPATNRIAATVPLPVDVGVPIVLDDGVFFPGHQTSTAVVVDRATWTVTATPDLGRPTRCSQCGFDGNSIYAATDDSEQMDVLVVDATTFEVTGTIETLGANSIDADDGSLWVIDDTFGVLQRFDIG